MRLAVTRRLCEPASPLAPSFGRRRVPKMVSATAKRVLPASPGSARAESASSSSSSRWAVITASALRFDDGVTLPFDALAFGALRPPSTPRTPAAAPPLSLKLNLVGRAMSDGIQRSWKVKFVNIASCEQQVLVTETLRRGIAAAARAAPAETLPLRRALTLSALEHLMHEWTVMETVLRSDALARARTTARDLAAVEALLLGVVTTGKGSWRPGVALDANSPVCPDHARSVALRAYKAEATRLRALGHGGAQRNLMRAARGAALLWQEAPMVSATRTFTCSWGKASSSSLGDVAPDTVVQAEAEAVADAAAAAALLARAGDHAMHDVATRWFSREQGGRVLIGGSNAAALSISCGVRAPGTESDAPPLLSPTAAGQSKCTDFHGSAEELRDAFRAAMAVREGNAAECAALSALMELVPLLCRDEVLRFAQVRAPTYRYMAQFDLLPLTSSCVCGLPSRFAQGVVRLAQPCAPHTFFSNSGRRVPPPLLIVPRRCTVADGVSCSASSRSARASDEASDEARDDTGTDTERHADRDVHRAGDELFEVYSVVDDTLLFCHLEHTDASSVGLSRHSEMLSSAPKTTATFRVISTITVHRALHSAPLPVGATSTKNAAAVMSLEGAVAASGATGATPAAAELASVAGATRAGPPAVAALAAHGLYATLSRRIERGGGGGGGALKCGISPLEIDTASPWRQGCVETPRRAASSVGSSAVRSAVGSASEGSAASSVASSAVRSAVGSAVGTPWASPHCDVDGPGTPASYRHGPARGCTSVFAGLSRLFGPTAAVGALDTVDFARLRERERAVRSGNAAAVAAGASVDGFVLVDVPGAMMPPAPPTIERSPLRRVSNAMRALVPDSAATPRRERRSSMTRARHFIAALKSPLHP